MQAASTVFPLPDNTFARQLDAYLSAACFRPRPENEVAPFGNPWWRPIEKGTPLTADDLALPLAVGDVASRKARVLHRALYNIYEQSLLFLPVTATDEVPVRAGASANPDPMAASAQSGSSALADYHAFYDPQLVALGVALRPHLEHLAFSALAAHVRPTGPWTMEAFRAYTRSVLKEHDTTPSSVSEAIRACSDPVGALRFVAKQQCSDALTEASGMSRYLGGSYGPPQSELTKVFVDEYGFGVHADKHSVIFEAFAASLGLRTDVHAYFHEYETASLLSANYFHWITTNKLMWPRYMGAIYFAEASLPHVNGCMSALVKEIAPNAERRYFVEHVEIDDYHKRMVLENVVAPLVATHGAAWMADILSGFEEFRVVGDILGDALVRAIRQKFPGQEDVA